MAALSDPKLEHFAQSVAYGFTAKAAAEAAGLHCNPTEARMLTQQADVRARIDNVCSTRNFDSAHEKVMAAYQLEADRDFAYEMGQPGAAIAATVARAKLLGIFVEESRSTNHVAVSNPDRLTPEEWSAKFGGHDDDKEAG